MAGRRVFEADSRIKLVMVHINEMPVPPSEISELDVPADLEAIVMR